MYGLSKNIKLWQSFAIIVFTAVKPCTINAQEKDTFYILDYYTRIKPMWPNKDGFINSGTTISFASGEQIKLIAGKGDIRIKIKKLKYYHPFPRHTYIIGVRIIQPKGAVTKIHIKSEKKVLQKDFVLDTLLTINNSLQRPWVFWQFMREKNAKLFNDFNPVFEMTNFDFLYKKNYLRPEIMQAVYESIHYEYQLQEERLIKLKKE